MLWKATQTLTVKTPLAKVYVKLCKLHNEETTLKQDKQTADEQHRSKTKVRRTASCPPLIKRFEFLGLQVRFFNYDNQSHRVRRKEGETAEK